MYTAWDASICYGRDIAALRSAEAQSCKNAKANSMFSQAISARRIMI